MIKRNNVWTTPSKMEIMLKIKRKVGGVATGRFNKIKKLA